MKGAPRSEQFDDIYFSAEDGLEETAYVFLAGNNLPQAWDGFENGSEARRESFTIAETGFGTGLNFLTAWKLFEETTSKGQRLDFISVEKYPLTAEEIRGALAPWANFFETRIEQFLDLYPIRIAGFHRIKINSQITLTLIFDDINEALPKLDACVDCWFLDGFTPAKNPDMWSDVVFQQMARLSRRGTTFSTFTAAGDVRRGLEATGFSVEKKKGFGHKRDMIAGAYQGENKSVGKNRGRVSGKALKYGSKIAIIGGGLAGTSCAYVLKQYGYEPVIYEQGDVLPGGASGNLIGLYNPRFSKLRDDLSDFFAPAYAHFIRFAKQAGDEIEYTPCGTLHLMGDEKKEERLKSMARHWMWHEDHVQLLNAAQASKIAGIEIDDGALYLPDAGSVCPKKLCAYYARGVEIHLNAKIEDLLNIDADGVVLATGSGVQNFEGLTWLPVEDVRGQVTLLEETSKSHKLKCNLCYGGYLSPSHEIDGKAIHVAGSTFEKWVTHMDVTQKNHNDNIRRLKENIDGLAEEDFVVSAGGVGMRAATNDRFPVAGAVPNHANVYVSAAYGSHGIIGSFTSAHVIADMMRGGALSLPEGAVRALSPYRFVERAAKKGRILV